MTPLLLDKPLQAWRGDNYSVTFAAWLDAGKTTPKDLSTYGSTWTAQLRYDADDATPAATFTVDSTLATTGKITLSLPAATVAALDGKYGFDVQASSGGNITTVWHGDLVVNKDWTR